MTQGRPDEEVVQRHLAADRLADLSVLPREFSEQLRGMAGFRNVLVHGYLRVDLNVVEQVLGERLQDFETFARHVEAYLARH